MNGLTGNQKSVLKLLANELFGVGNSLSSSEISSNFEELFQECKSQSIALLVAGQIEDLRWKQYAMKNLARNITVEYAHCQIHEFLVSNHIPYVILKGCASSKYYPKPINRSLGDVDFLVRREDLYRTDKLLKSKEFQFVNVNSHHIDLKKDNVCYEIHFDINGIPEDNVGDKIRKYMSDLIDTSEKVELSNGTIYVPDDFHHGLIILIHMAHHMTSTGIGLRHLCDWAVFVDHMGERFPEIFKEALEKIGLWKFANQMTATCIEFLEMPILEWCESFEIEFLEAIMIDIFQSGNFGRKKDGNPQVERLLFRDKKTRNIGKQGIFRQLLSNGNSSIESHWSIAKKIKILYLFGWIHFGIRFVIHGFGSKEKKINIVTTIRNTNGRRNLYSKFRLFEV